MRSETKYLSKFLSLAGSLCVFVFVDGKTLLNTQVTGMKRTMTANQVLIEIWVYQLKKPSLNLSAWYVDFLFSDSLGSKP